MINLNWDKDKSKETKIIREMLYSSPEKVLKKYSREDLKQMLFKFHFKFDKRNQEFWGIILNIDEKEFEKLSTESFRTSCDIWHY